MVLGPPQIIYLLLICIGIGFALARYGEQKRDRYDMFDVFFGPALVLILLWTGGFFGR
jgi:hypothetical protein